MGDGSAGAGKIDTDEGTGGAHMIPGAVAQVAQKVSSRLVTRISPALRHRRFATCPDPCAK